MEIKKSLTENLEISRKLFVHRIQAINLYTKPENLFKY